MGLPRWMEGTRARRESSGGGWLMGLTVTRWVWLRRLHSYTSRQRLNNKGLRKLHGDSLRVLARLIKTHFGGVSLEGMQELYRDSCKQEEKTQGDKGKAGDWSGFQGGDGFIKGTWKTCLISPKVKSGPY